MRPDIMEASFCVSITAAMGMPKLEAGPQKSIIHHIMLARFCVLDGQVNRCEGSHWIAVLRA
jgi:hypothetical protein